MSERLEISVEKLSALIEDLNLDQRACNRLSSAGIHTVSQIIAKGKPDVLAIRNIGPLLANRIFSAVADYLGVSEDILEDDGITQLALKEKDKTLDPLNVSIVTLALPNNLILLLRKAGISRIEQLIKFRSNNYENNNLFGKVEARKIERALRLFVEDLDKKKMPQTATPQVAEENQNTEFSSLKNLDLVLNSLRLNERAWLVVELRSVRLLTLEEIAVEIGGVTRERVRQIIDQVNEKIRAKLSLLLFFYDYLNGRTEIIRKKLKNKGATIEFLASECKLQLADSNLIATDEDLERFIAIIRLLAISNKPWARERFGTERKNFTFLVCLVEPSIEKHAKVNQFLEREKEKNRQLSHKEIAYLVLSEAKRPLHWREIVEKAYKLNKRDHFETRALYHALLNHDDLFVRVGKGTYELVEWGHKQAKPYPDVIAAVLSQERRALPFDKILVLVSSIRSIKQPSLFMYMEMHPRFYKAINNLYGLRGWLPPREKQNLRTPEWLVEDSKSHERLERAKQRGYDVDSIIREDKLL